MNTTVVQTITFGGDGNARNFQVSGWSDPETGYTWSTGPECALMLPAIDAPAGFLVELECAIFRPVTLDVRVNDATVASRVIDAPGTFVWQAPATRDPVPIRLTFRHPDAQRPCDVTASWDTRPLGLLWQRLRLLRLDPAADAEPDQPNPKRTAFPTLESLERHYQDEPSVHRLIYDACETAMSEDARLLAHREYVEHNRLGFGDRAFHWLWKLLVDAMPSHFKFLEIGVYKGQVTSLLGMLASLTGKTVENLGVTPLGTFGDKFSHYEDVDYLAEIRSIEAWCGLPEGKRARIIPGFSNDDRVKRECRAVAPFDLVYIDGCHDYHVVANDIIAYGEMLKPRGLLVMDDASTELRLPAGIWPGHADVGRAVREILEPMQNFARVASVGHLRVWRKTTGDEGPPV